MPYDRMLQVTFGCLNGAARRKNLNGRSSEKVSFPKCGLMDSWSHCKERYGLVVLTQEEDKQWVVEVDRIMNVLCAPNTAAHVPSPLEGQQTDSGKLKKTKKVRTETSESGKI